MRIITALFVVEICYCTRSNIRKRFVGSLVLGGLLASGAHPDVGHFHGDTLSGEYMARRANDESPVVGNPYGLDYYRDTSSFDEFIANQSGLDNYGDNNIYDIVSLDEPWLDEVVSLDLLQDTHIIGNPDRLSDNADQGDRFNLAVWRAGRPKLDSYTPPGLYDRLMGSWIYSSHEQDRRSYLDFIEGYNVDLKGELMMIQSWRSDQVKNHKVKMQPPKVPHSDIIDSLRSAEIKCLIGEHLNAMWKECESSKDWSHCEWFAQWSTPIKNM